MKRSMVKIVLWCLLLSVFIFSQSENEGITEGKTPSETLDSEETAGEMEKTSVVDNVQSAEVMEKSKFSADKNADAEIFNKEETGGLVDVAQLRKESKLLQAQAEKLYEKAEKFGGDAEEVNDAIEELEDLVDDLEDEAEELLKQASKLRMCIKMDEESPSTLPLDSTLMVNDTTGDTVILAGNREEHRALMYRMRNSADQLLQKAKVISLQVREMKETSGEKEDLSDRFEDKADELEDKAEELEEAADSLEEQLNTIPLANRFPFRIGHQMRIAAVPPYDDKKVHVLLTSGLHFSYYFRNFIAIGLEEITIRFNETIYGTRVAICASPLVSYSLFPLKKLELGFGAGVAVQGQVGADRSYDIAAAPFIKLYNENWVTKRFSLGPVLKFNYCANGEFFTRVLPADNAKVLPKKAWWMDFGITYTFHL